MRFSFLKSLLIVFGCLFLLSSTPNSAQEAEFIEGQDYLVIQTEIREELEIEELEDKIQVTEYFNYKCPHCYRLEPEINVWLESKPNDVEFIREAIPLRNQWVPVARAYYVAVELDVVDEIHDLMFSAIWERNLPMEQEDLIERLFETRADVEAELFQETYQSETIRDYMRDARTKMQLYGLQGTPAFVINDLYVVDTKSAGETPMFEIIDFLIEKIRNERAPDS